MTGAVCNSLQNVCPFCPQSLEAPVRCPLTSMSKDVPIPTVTLITTLPGSSQESTGPWASPDLCVQSASARGLTGSAALKDWHRVRAGQGVSLGLSEQEWGTRGQDGVAGCVSLKEPRAWRI